MLHKKYDFRDIWYAPPDYEGKKTMSSISQAFVVYVLQMELEHIEEPRPSETIGGSKVPSHFTP